jgi:HEAT repeat protein
MKKKDILLRMDDNPFILLMTQPALFEDIDESSHGAIELFPAVWGAVEDLAAPEAALRHQALDRLEDLNAPRLSPLVAYMIATRLTDPDLSFRQRAIQVLGQVLSPDAQGNLPQDSIVRYLTSYLSQMRTRAVYPLLEAAADSPSIAPYLARLFNACPYTGSHLGDILTNRKMPLRIRKQAAYFLGEVGFLDSIPVLERLEARLASRLVGQQSMAFAPPSAGDEIELLPDVQKALLYLKTI